MQKKSVEVTLLPQWDDLICKLEVISRTEAF